MVTRTVMKDIGSVDPDVVVPPAIRRANERADAAYRAAYGGENTENTGENTQNEGEKTDETLVKITEPAQNQPKTVVENADFKPPEVRQNAPEPQKTTENKVVEQPKADDWERRYHAMNGRFQQSTTAIQQLNSDNAKLAQRNAQLEGMIISMQQSVQPARGESRITAEERESYGDGFLEVAGKRAREELEPEIAALRSELTQIKGKFGEVAVREAQTAADRAYATLANAVPQWKEINASPEFIAWLGLPDGYSGVTRMSLLSKALQDNDGNRMARFFQGFQAEQAAVAPATPTTPSPQKVSLESLAAPGRAKSAAASSAPADKPIIKRSEIHQFYQDVQHGKYRNNEAERARLEGMIFEAQLEGRITE